MTCFLVPSDIRSLKEKLKVLVIADTILAFLPFFAMILCFILNLVFPNELGPLEAEDSEPLGFTCVWVSVFQLALVWGLSSLLKKHSTLGFYGYCFFKIYLQCMWIALILILAFAPRRNESEAPLALAYYFLVGLIIFYVTLTPYQIYELILVIYFHYLSTKTPNPADVVNFVSIDEVGVEIGVPPRGDVN